MVGFCFGGGGLAGSYESPELKTAVPYYGPNPRSRASATSRWRCTRCTGRMISASTPASWSSKTVEQNDEVFEKIGLSSPGLRFSESVPSSNYNPHRRTPWQRALDWFRQVRQGGSAGRSSVLSRSGVTPSGSTCSFVPSTDRFVSQRAAHSGRVPHPSRRN